MTTLKLAGSNLWKAIGGAAVLMLWGCGAHADGLDVASSGATPASGQHANCDPSNVLNSALNNRYVLLLFFDKTANKKDIQDAFDQPDPDKPGCIRDPDQDAKGMRGILVQGSCPTDCAHKRIEGLEGGVEKKYKGGDPLQRTKVKLGNSMIPEHQESGHQKAAWALYLADPAGAKEEATEDDPDLTFLIWQILPKDACHAASILRSLKQRTDTKVFTRDGGYRGQIMIGYTPRWKLEKSTTTSKCDAVEPRQSISR
jgi:hypothetical protein